MLTSILRYVSGNLLLKPTVNKNPPLDECFKSGVQHSSRMALEVIGAAAIINGAIHREVNDWIRRLRAGEQQLMPKAKRTHDTFLPTVRKSCAVFFI